MERRLAAIFSADVKGYSRLMGDNDEATVQTLTTYREVMTTLVEQHRGRVVDSPGDNMLAEFASAVDAVRCAVEIQRELKTRNAKLPADRQMVFRIGVNLGDVLVEGQRIYGDGVNIAARLESLAQAGGICISGKVFEEVETKLPLGYEDVGEQQVKNIAKPVRVYRVQMEPESDSSRGSREPVSALPDKPSIAVLPFNNMSGDPEQAFFADGLAEDIITTLAKNSRMHVIARNSTFVYKGQAVDIRKVASELSVRYVLEGSIRSGGNRLRITAQLIDANDGGHVWSERYDRTIDDLFDIQDDITKEIVTALRVQLTDGEEALMWARGTNDIEAWQLCVRSRELIQRWNTTDYLEARALAEKALSRDPNYAFAWACVGATYWWDGRLGYTGDAEDKLARANECAQRALSCDDSLPWALSMSTVVAGSQNRVSDGIAIARRGVELYPGIADMRANLGLALTRANQYGEAVEHFRAAMSLNPFCPNWYRNGLGRSLLLIAEFDEALRLFEELLEIEPTHLHAKLQKAYILGQIGRLDDAKHEMNEVRRIAPDLGLEHIPELMMVSDDAIAQHLVEGFQSIGLPA